MAAAGTFGALRGVLSGAEHGGADAGGSIVCIHGRNGSPQVTRAQDWLVKILPLVKVGWGWNLASTDKKIKQVQGKVKKVEEKPQSFR